LRELRGFGRVRRNERAPNRRCRGCLSRGRALRARGEVNREGALHDHGEASRDKRVKYVHEGALHIQLLKSGMRGGGDECDIPCMHVDW